MKKKYITLFALFGLFLTGLIACSGKNKKSSSALVIDSLHINEVIHLDDDSAKPYCAFTTSFAFISKAEKPYIKDSINRAITANILGDEYQDLPLKEAVDSFQQTYFTQFKEDVGPQYKADIKDNPTQTKLRWYNYTKDIKSDFIFNEDDVLTLRANTWDNTGGAHGMYSSYFLNFNSLTGKIIHLSDIFADGYEKGVTEQILAKLERMMKVKTEKDLEDLGFFNNSSLTPTENFYITNDEICFYYNVYDIAPYPIGALDVKLPFDAIRSMMKTDHNPLAEILE